MSDLKARLGESLTKRKWDRLVDRLPQGRTPGNPATGPFIPANSVMAGNLTEIDYDFGECVAIQRIWSGPDTIYGCMSGIILDIGEVQWQGSIGMVGVCWEPIAADAWGRIAISGLCIAKMGSSGNGGFLLPDPTDTKILLETTGGIAKLIAKESEGFGVIDLGCMQPLFRYERTADWGNPSDAMLISLDGEEIGEISLSDPEAITDDQGPGDTGLCMMAYNSFRVINANCELVGSS